jgi:hypothetical protein
MLCYCLPMSAKANQAVCSLYHLTVFDLRSFAKNRREMEKLEESYFRYNELLRLDLQYREKLRQRYGLLGVHFPNQFVSPSLAKQLSPLDNVSSGEVRKELKLWEVLREFLSVAGESTYSQFRSFLCHLSFPEPSSQALDSAIKTHPELFEERSEDREKHVRLKSSEMSG